MNGGNAGGGGARALASLSLDLDNQWSYLKTHGDPGWEALPSYLDVVVPLLLRLFDETGVTASVFVVGQDAALDRNAEAFGLLGQSRHEVANHSFKHEPWLHLYTAAQIDDELQRAHDAIGTATGRVPTGFRGPGYSVSAPLLEALRAKGYTYDASTLPTWIGPLARAYYFRTARLSKEERKRREGLFGSFRDGAKPVAPYRWTLPGGGLVELPVTVMPVLRVPFHVSYLLYLHQVSPALARGWFRAGLRLCRLTGVEPSILLHPLDLLGGDDVGGLAFFPGMGMAGEAKRALVAECVAALAERYAVVPVGTHADAIGKRSLPARTFG
jgi:peptidoglycan/xylan/chitin deacetylase (PgdA/CDA1 family)